MTNSATAYLDGLRDQLSQPEEIMYAEDYGPLPGSEALRIGRILATERGGWLYAILAEDVGRVKIGRAKNVWRNRALLFQTGSPVELAPHSATLEEDVYAAESAAHRVFAPARVQGEWFQIDIPIQRWLALRELERPSNALYWRYETHQQAPV